MLKYNTDKRYKLTIAIYGYCWTTLLILAISMSRLFCHTSIIGPVELVEVGMLSCTGMTRKGHHWQKSTYNNTHGHTHTQIHVI